MKKLTKEDIVELFDQFINDYGLFYKFKDWLNEKGYSLDEIGMQDEE